MAWAVHREWGRKTNDVKDELASVIRAIARYEPVKLLTSPGDALREAQREFGSESNIELVEAPVDDIWLRDIAPTFAIRGEDIHQEMVAIDWHFASWGNLPDRRRRPGDRLASVGSSVFKVPLVEANFVMEGGAFVVDGQGQMIVTRSCLLHPSRNPVLGPEDRQHRIENDLSRFGISRVIWLEGDPCERGTNGHVDGFILLGSHGAILIEMPDKLDPEPPMWREHDAMLLRTMRGTVVGTDPNIRYIYPPRTKYLKSTSEMFAPAYLNAYPANGAVIMASFGDPQRDEIAGQEIANAFPDRAVVQLRINSIAEGGGGIHCLTQPMPTIRAAVSALTSTRQ